MNTKQNSAETLEHFENENEHVAPFEVVSPSYHLGMSLWEKLADAILRQPETSEYWERIELNRPSPPNDFDNYLHKKGG